jgi:16S rRNA (guanine(1405)-N(7))-methyltransferase
VSTRDAERPERVVAAIKASKKYRHVHARTIEALVRESAGRYRDEGELDKAVRKRLHGIVASHLGDPDYGRALTRLREVGPEARADVCRELLDAHLSTRERAPYVERFYRELFACTGVPGSVLDLACGLGPLAAPLSGLASGTPWHALDIHEPRVAFLAEALPLLGYPGVARVHDIVLDPIPERADVALLLKEIHRIQKYYEGVDAEFLARIPARTVAVSYPAVSAHNHRDLRAHYREGFAELVGGRWSYEELEFPHELVFVIRKEA